MEKIFFQNKQFSWFNLKNPDKTEMESLKEKFGLTSFTIQDAIEVEHLPKFEHQENFEFILVRFYSRQRRSSAFVIREFSHKIGIFVGKDFLITVHQQEIPFWDKIISKLSDDSSPHKAYHEILKETLNSFFEPSQKIAKNIEDYEQSLLDDDREIKKKLKKLYLLKRESDVCKTLMKRTQETLTEYKHQAKNKSAFLDILELNQKLLHLHTQNSNDLQNLFTLTISLSDLRSNEIMKILTIFSAFFLPLTFIAGIYGMNFSYMPELDYKWSYFVVLGLMVVLVLIIFIWFKRKKYL